MDVDMFGLSDGKDGRSIFVGDGPDVDVRPLVV